MLPETSSISAIIQFLEYSNIVDNITQCILWNSSKLQRDVIETMVDLVQFWFIQETELVQNAPRSIFNIRFLNSHTKTIVRTVSNEIGPTSFLFSMKKLWLFYQEYLFIN